MPHNKQLEKIQVKSQLRYKIQPETYHMYYIIGSEDILHKSIAQQDQESSNNDDKNQWNQWLSNQGNDELNDATRKLFS